MSLSGFHPAVERWFTGRFAEPTAPQRRAWPLIRSGRDVLIAAPTGSGKTFAAFLAAIDDLLRQGLGGTLQDGIQVVYVSPLKALSNDVQKNLSEPLAEIRRALEADGLPDVDVRVLLRTGDTAPAERQAMLKRPPHILVTTPESLYLILTSERAREMLRSVRTVIVDEIHAVARDKRGSHLALSLERLAALARGSVQRIGLSATQKPIEEIARFLMGTGRPLCDIIDEGHHRLLDLALEIPSSPLEAVMSGEVWEEVYERLAQLIAEHRTTLVFVNTRRLCERLTMHLSERLGAEQVTSHHGSLSREKRLDAETRLKNGELKALVATASLELGIDIGSVDLVCQLSTPRSIATLLQRVGRSGHRLGAVPKGRLFPLSRDDLIECTALLRAAREGKLDRLIIPEKPLDILAQQVVAMAACEDWDEDALYELARRASPYRNLSRAEFDDVVRMLADGFTTKRGRRAAYLHYDGVNHRLRARRGARLAALTSGGAIPDLGDYRVVLEPTETFVGTLNEDFAIESAPGDIFQLGNASYLILRVESGQVRVADARGQPPTLPFWLGEAPARTDELSAEVSRLRGDIERRPGDVPGAIHWLVGETGVAEPAARQIVEYLLATKQILGVIPSQETLVLERFFDEAGGMQLVLHAPFGARINKAWGLSLRKKFCRSFNFELQAAANDEAIVLSLGPHHSFPLDGVFQYLNAATVRDTLIQAMLVAPMFQSRWRWNATRALAVLRFRGGQEGADAAAAHGGRGSLGGGVPGPARLPREPGGRPRDPQPPAHQPDGRGLPERGDGPRGTGASARRDRGRALHPDRPRHHGAVADRARDPQRQAVRIPRRRAARGAPHAGGGDPPLARREDRRGVRQARRRRRSRGSGRKRGRRSAMPTSCTTRCSSWGASRNAKESSGARTAMSSWRAGRAGALRITPPALDRRRAPADARGGVPEASCVPALVAPERDRAKPWTREESVRELVRGRLEVVGPTTAAAIAAALGLPVSDVEFGLGATRARGVRAARALLSGPDASWNGASGGCWRASIGTRSTGCARRSSRSAPPISCGSCSAGSGSPTRPARRAPRASRRCSTCWTASSCRPAHGRATCSPRAWPTTIRCGSTGSASRGRSRGVGLSSAAPPAGNGAHKTGPIRTTPLALFRRERGAIWRAIHPEPDPAKLSLSHSARALYEALEGRGASFFGDLVNATGLLRTEVEKGLSELVAWGLVVSDSFAGLRALLVPSERRRPIGRLRRRGRIAPFGVETAGRWSRVGHGRSLLPDGATGRGDRVDAAAAIRDRVPAPVGA